MDAYSIAVVDDDDAVRVAIVELLRSAGFRVEGFGSPTVFLEVAKQGTPFDCLILDEQMDECSGIETFRRLRNMGMTFPGVMVTGHATVKLTMEAVEVGISYLFEKPFDKTKVVERTLRYCDEYRRTRKDKIRQENERAILATLSEREIQVLRLLASGYLNKQIAGELKVGLRTVETYRNRVMNKIGAKSFADAVAFAISVGLRKPGVRYRAG